MPKKSGKNPIKIALSGSSGRMGQEIQTFAQQDVGFKITAMVERTQDWSKVKPAGVDVAVDFSSPEGFSGACAWCLKNAKPLVSGTTGLASEDFTRLKKVSAKIPVLYSANMSIGIAALSAMLGVLGELSDWDFQVDEAHHIHKKDRPSGTALLLQQKLEKVIGRKLPEINAVRGGGIPGIHQIWAMGPDEALVLHHTAFNRKVFARGALGAARWLFDKKAPGLYDLSDLYKMT